MNYKKFKMLVFSVLFSMNLVGFISMAQQSTITGVVKDAATGDPIIGANILEKGTTNGTITNFDGVFTLSASSKATLLIKYVGYVDVEVAVAGKKNLTIQLKEDAIALGEMLVIGYGTVRKDDATGSVTAIKPDKLNKGQTTSAQDMIIGKVAGVSVTSGGGAPGSGATIRIRGGSSLSASNDPLIVIDGLAMDNNGIKGVANFLSTINPNDIETFTVLKDASAAAIYGSRASNGVIIITTKKGVEGSKPKVSYDGNVSLGVLPNKLEVMNGDEFREFVTNLYGAGSEEVAELGTENTDWQSYIFQNALSHDHNINVTGGLKNMPYRASVGYTSQDGVLKTSNFERITGAISLSPSFFDNHLKINLNTKGMITESRFAETGAIGSATAFDPTQPVTSDDPTYQTFGGYWQWHITDPNMGITKNSLATQNPLATLMQRSDIANANNIIASADADYKFHWLPELHAHINLGMESAFGKQVLDVSKEAYGDHLYGRLGSDEISKTNKSLNSYLQYNKELDKHRIDLMGGYEWQHFYREGKSMYVGYPDGYVPNYNLIENEWKTENFLVSFFGRANYAFNNKHLLTATVRYDGSSRFAAENRWGLFPSFAYAWKIMEEDFMKSFDIMSDLKLRLGYGITGQQDLGGVGDYQYLPVYQTNKIAAYYPENGEYVSTSRPNAYNPFLKWEETTTYNAGIDYGLMNSRITGSIDYYYRVTNDLLNVVDVPAGTNFSNRVVSNIGSLQNAGLEFSINGKAISTRDLVWDLGYNISFNKNEITKLTSGTGEGYYVATGGISAGTGNNIQAHSVGHPASSFYVYEQIYDDNGKPIEGSYVDRDNNEIINDNDRYFYHNPAADITMGFSSKLIYKNFDFGFNLRASIGNYVYNDVESRNGNVGATGIWSTSGFFSNRPKSTLEANFVNIAGSNYYLSDYYVRDASFVRVDNITLGYSFKNLFKVISSGRIYGTVQNPLVLTKYTGLDPEVFGGIDRDLYPRPVVTMLGLSLNF